MVGFLLRAASAPSEVEACASTPPLTKTARVMLVLLERAVGEHNAISGRQVRMATRMVADDVHRILAAQAGAGRSSRKRAAGAGKKGEMLYWLDWNQASAAEAYRLPLQSGRLPYRHDGVSARDLAARLQFLLHIKESTYLGEFKVLDHIISDYRAALKSSVESEA